MPDYIQRRTACDRCHSHKLRCPKSPGVTDNCARCIKAGAVCTYSPSIRGQRPPVKPSPKEKENSHPITKTTVELVDFDQSDSIGNSTLDGSQQASPPNPNPDLSLANDVMAVDWGYEAFATESSCDIGNSLDNLEFNYQSFNPSNNEFDHGTHFDTLQVQHGQQSEIFQWQAGPKQGNRKECIATAPNAFAAKAQLTNASLSQPDSLGPPSDNVESCIQQLAILSTSLYAHFRTIPKLKQHSTSTSPPTMSSSSSNVTPEETPPSDSDQRSHDNLVSDQMREFRVDHTFKLTQSLVNLYKSFTPHLVRCGPPSDNVDHIQDSTSFTNLLLDQPMLDHSSILLLLSCHLRLIETYDILLFHMEECIGHAINIPNFDATLKNVPAFYMGSLEIEETAAVAVQFSLLISLSGQLVDRVRRLLALIRSASRTARNTSNAVESGGIDDTIESTCVSVFERAEKLLQKIVHIKDAVRSSDIVIGL